MARIAADQAEGLRRLLAPRRAKVVAFTGGAPGVGCSSAAANVAAALARRGRTVLLLQADPAQRSAHGSADALAPVPAGAPGSEAGDEGVVTVAAGEMLAALPELAPAECDRLASGLGLLAPGADAVLVDLPPGVACVPLAACLAADEVVTVVSNHAEAITDAYALVKVLNRQFGRRRFRVLVNRARDEEHAWAIFGNIARVSTRFLDAFLDFAGWIPADASVHHAGLTRRPVVDVFPRSAAATRLRQLAESVDQWSVPAAEDGGVAGFVRRLAEAGRRVENFRL